jgi:signal transduction histidine kinase
VTLTREVRAGLTALALAGLGVAVLRLGYAPFDQRAGLVGVLAAWILAASGLLAWLRVPGSRVGPLLVIAAAAGGVAMLAIGLANVEAGMARELLAGVAMPVLGHAILTMPTGRAHGRGMSAALIVLYATLVLPSLEAGLVQTGIVAAGFGARALRRTPTSRATVAAGAAYVVGTTGLAALLVLPVTGGDARIVTSIAAAAIGLLLAGDIVADAGRRRRILDFVVDLDGGDASRGVTPRLEALLAQPELVIAYRRQSDGRFVDAAGRLVTRDGGPGGPGSAGQVTTSLEHDGETVALIRHRAGAVADPGVRSALARAAALVVAHRALRDDVARQLDEVERSRRRLIQAADEENLQLRLELEERVGSRLDSLGAALEAIAPSERARRADREIEQLGAARREIGAILDGLPPRDLDGGGLAAALMALAARSPLPVRASIAGAGPDDVATSTALYFSCSEGLANATRHAGATSVNLTLACDDDRWVLELADDGRGGAAIGTDAGTGLLGLRDRLDAVGGRLDVQSPAGGGTRLVASVPRVRQASASG